jgi:hypothetical protein
MRGDPLLRDPVGDHVLLDDQHLLMGQVEAEGMAELIEGSSLGLRGAWGDRLAWLFTACQVPYSAETFYT